MNLNVEFVETKVNDIVTTSGEYSCTDELPEG